jgi:hypothetical protein
LLESKEKQQVFVPYTLVDQTIQQLREVVAKDERSLFSQRCQELKLELENRIQHYFDVVQQLQKLVLT